MPASKIIPSTTSTASAEGGVLFVPVVTLNVRPTVRLAAALNGTRVIGGVITEALSRALTLDLDFNRNRGAGVELVNR